MANNISNLKFYINPATNPTTHEPNTAMSAADIANYGTNAGYLAFDEVTNLFYVRGVGYGLSISQATDLANALSAIQTLNGDVNTSGSVLYTLHASLGTLTANLATGATDATVEALITALQTQITGLDNSVVKRSTGEGHTDYANTDAIAAAIAAAETTARSGAVSDVIGDGTTANENAELGNNTWLYGEDKTLSHLKDLINLITGGSDVDLASIQETIAKIENELKVGDESTINYTTTILDAYRTLRGTGDLTVNSVTKTTLQGIIDALEGLISAADTKAGKHSIVTDGVEGNATAGSTNYAVVTSSESNGQTTYTVQTTSALDTVASNASAAKSATDILTGSASTAGSLAKAVADLKGTSGDVASAETIAGAKAYADSVAATQASTAAGQVVSWTIISAGS